MMTTGLALCLAGGVMIIGSVLMREYPVYKGSKVFGFLRSGYFFTIGAAITVFGAILDAIS